MKWLKQLEDAFQVADSWVRDKRYHYPLGGFGRGSEWGDHVLEHFMPKWFEDWMKHENWCRASLLQGFNGWKIWTEAMGYDPFQKWEELMEIFVRCHLEHHSLTLAECEKPEVLEYYGPIDDTCDE